MSLSPVISSLPATPNIGWNNSWVAVPNDQNRLLYAQAVYDVSNLGNNGITVITGTSQVDGNFSAIQMITNTTFSGLTATNGTSVANITSPTFPAGFTLNGLFKNIKLSGGSVIAYNA